MQAGAARVYAIEASDIARCAQRLFDANGDAGARITLVHGKVESARLPERADVLISEPMGTLLVNERMLETYVLARKAMLKPGGRMFPGLGRIWVAAFSDAPLHAELAASASFWSNASFYGVDLSNLYAEALEVHALPLSPLLQGFRSRTSREIAPGVVAKRRACVQSYHGKVVIDAFDPGLLVSTRAMHAIDFAAVDESELLEIRIPLSLVCRGPGVVHGLACWFDVQFSGSEQQPWLSTAPGMPPTHWFQLRCVLQVRIPRAHSCHHD